jgi:hypothetical protein
LALKARHHLLTTLGAVSFTSCRLHSAAGGDFLKNTPDVEALGVYQF